MKTVKQNFDLQGLEVRRITRRSIAIKLVPIWAAKENPGLVPLLDLLIRHYLGYPIAFITEKYQRHWFKLLSLWRHGLKFLTQGSENKEK